MLRQADSKPVAANGVTASRARRKCVIVLRTRAAAEPDRKPGEAVSKSHIIERVKTLDLPSTEALLEAKPATRRLVEIRAPLCFLRLPGHETPFRARLPRSAC
jgi:hypothetical protein